MKTNLNTREVEPRVEFPTGEKPYEFEKVSEEACVSNRKCVPVFISVCVECAWGRVLLLLAERWLMACFKGLREEFV